MKHLDCNAQMPLGGAIGPVLRLDEIESGASPGFMCYSSDERAALIEVEKYATSYLVKPHNELGRAGPVCPYVPNSIVHRTFYVASTRSSCVSYEAVEKIASGMPAIFESLEPNSAEPESLSIFKCLLVLFPELGPNAEKIILPIQRGLKSKCMSSGYMIGEFYPGCPVPGLHNPSFRPFHMPVPCIAMRFMTEYDIPFAIEGEDFLRAYLGCFGADGSARLVGYAQKLPQGPTRDRITRVLRASEDLSGPGNGD